MASNQHIARGMENGSHRRPKLNEMKVRFRPFRTMSTKTTSHAAAAGSVTVARRQQHQETIWMLTSFLK
jgi:hypothetical protein